MIGPFPTPHQCFQSLNPSTNIRSASDGAVLHCQGFQGWIIATMDNTILIEGFGAMDGHVEDINSYRAEICANIATFSVFTLIQKVCGFSAPTIEHVCDNQSVIIATWKDEKINVFDKTKANADVSKDARTAIADLQCHSKVKAFWA
jgi:hypothetical protein